MGIPASGPITALTWALQIGEVQRFSSIKKVISYAAVCVVLKRVPATPCNARRYRSSATNIWQTTLIEAAKMAPRYSPTLALLYDRETKKPELPGKL